MKQPGEILLISCYELGHQPLAIASPLGFLKQAGYVPAAIDLSVERLDEEKVKRGRFIGISVPMHTALRLGVRVAKLVRRIQPQCHICFYGLYASLNADYLLDSVADSVIGGEFEQPLLELVESLDKEIALNEGRGVSLRGRVTGPFLDRLSFPLPSRDELPPLERYAKLEEKDSQRLVGFVAASRGCSHHCRHCPIPPVYHGRFFVVPKNIVLEDIRALVQKGATHITFGDPDFLNGPGHSLAILRAMHQEFPILTFDFTAKIEHILRHREIFVELFSLGCLFVVSAVESLSDRVLANLEKGHTRQDVLTALAILKEAGIALRPTFVSFTPWTTLEDYVDLLDFVEREGLIDHVDPIQYTIRLLLPPGSLLLSTKEMQPFLGPLIESSLSYHWTDPDSRMDLLYRHVTQIVKEAAALQEDPHVTFYKIKEIADRMAGKENLFPDEISPQATRNRPARLTEAWFCCAEPTEEQFKEISM